MLVIGIIIILCILLFTSHVYAIDEELHTKKEVILLATAYNDEEKVIKPIQVELEAICEYFGWNIKGEVLALGCGEPEDITKTEDGTFIVDTTMIFDEWVYGYFLSFGSHVHILEPISFRQELRQRIGEMLKNYSER